MSKQQHGYAVHKDLVLYAYCYPQDLFAFGPKFYRLAVKFGMATLGKGETAAEAAKNRMDKQRQKDMLSGGTNEAFSKILLGAWHIRSDKIPNDHIFKPLLRDSGYYDQSLLTGSGTEWYLMPYNPADLLPEPLVIIEKMMADLADGDQDAFDSVLPGNGLPFRFEYENKMLTISEATKVFDDKVSTGGKLAMAFAQFIKRPGMSFRTVFLRALEESRVHSAAYPKALERFVFNNLSAHMVSERLYAPALLPCGRNASALLDRVPASAKTLEVVNDPLTFITAVVLGKFDQVTFVGTRGQVQDLSFLSADPMVRLIAINEDDSQPAYHAAVMNHLSTTHAATRILNTPLSVGTSAIAGSLWISAAKDTTDDLIAGVALDCVIDKKSDSNKFTDGLSGLHLLNDQTQIPELDAMFIKASVQPKQHFEPVGIVVYSKTTTTISVSDEREALVYGPADDHPLPLNVGRELVKLESVDDVSHIGHIPHLGEFVKAAKIAHGGSDRRGRKSVAKPGDVAVLIPDGVGNPSFKRSSTKSGAKIVLADGRICQIEKRYLASTQPLREGVIVPRVSVDTDVVPNTAIIHMPVARAEAYVQFELHDPSVIALHAIVNMKQTTIKTVLTSTVPIANIPWESIEVGKFDQYLAQQTGLDLGKIRSVVEEVIRRISYYIE